MRTKQILNNEYVRSLTAHLNWPTPGVMIEQGMLGKNGAVRAITPGNEDGPYELEHVHNNSGILFEIPRLKACVSLLF